uniref:EF-hand domain-containing protein n=1 Tax=Macrostomum lignano TaxID=282301 RepID=A0A1I8F2S7_9PLAT
MSNAELQAMLAEKAKELFDVCDIEQKASSPRETCSDSAESCHWTPTRLRTCSTGLDDDGNGYLTLEEFTGGFGSFMGLASGSGDGPTGGGGGGEADGEYIEEGRRGRRGFGEMGDDDGYSVEEDEHFPQTMEKLGAAGVFSGENPQLTTTRLRKLYEEMETQIRAERDKVLAEERAKEKQLREDMEREIREKEKLSSSAWMKINLVQAEDCSGKRETSQGARPLEEELSESREALEESQSYVEELQKKFKDDRRKRAQAAIALSEGIALERETLVRQLDTLRDVNKKLKDESDMNLDSGDRGLGFGEIVHFREGGEEGSSGGEAAARRTARLEGRGEELQQAESLQGLNAASAVIVGGETLADIMDGDEDDCEYDYDGDAGAFGGAGGGFGRGSPIRTIDPSPTSLSIWFRRCRHRRLRKETSETAIMMTPCPSRQPTPPPTPPPLPPPVSKCEIEIQTEEIRTADASQKPTLTLVSTDRRPKGPATKMPTRGHHWSKQLGACHADFASQIDNKAILPQSRWHSDSVRGIVIVYDVTNSVTYLHLREWMESVVEGAEDNAVKMVLGNKVDLAGEASSDGMQNVVDKKSGSQLADEFEALFYEVSAKSGSSINEAFHALAW